MCTAWKVILPVPKKKKKFELGNRIPPNYKYLTSILACCSASQEHKPESESSSKLAFLNICSIRDITVGKSSKIHSLYLKLVCLDVDFHEANRYTVKSSTNLIRMLVAFLDMSVEQSSNHWTL